MKSPHAGDYLQGTCHCWHGMERSHMSQMNEGYSTTYADLKKAMAAFREHPETAPLQIDVRGYEQKYGMTSHEMYEAVRNGEQVETGEICSWLLKYRCLSL